HEEAWSSETLLQRFGTAKEVSNVILTLASDDTSYVTGAVWTVDGGLLALPRAAGRTLRPQEK
ncbi:hypothetical protein AAVH_13569, partial [Aphelenchoides avenae]